MVLWDGIKKEKKSQCDQCADYTWSDCDDAVDGTGVPDGDVNREEKRMFLETGAFFFCVRK